MKYGQYLTRNRHGNIWHVRVVIPPHLRRHFEGQREFRRSTGTSDKSAAKVVARAFRVWCDQLFAEQERMPSTPPKKQRKLKSNEVGLITFINLDGSQTIIDYKEHGDAAPALELSAALALQNRKAAAQPGSDHKRVRNPMTVAELATEYKKRQKARVSDKKSSSSITQQTYTEELNRIDFWAVCFGERQDDAILRKEVIDVQDWLPFLQPGYTRKKISHAEAIKFAKEFAAEAVDDDEGNFISATTHNKYIVSLRGMLKLAEAIEAHTEDLSSRLKFIDGAKYKRLPFDEDDMRKIFCGKEYGKDFGNESSGVSPEARFWLPLLGAFTGCRAEELGQLTCASFQVKAGVAHLRITDMDLAADGKRARVKNANSVRPVRFTEFSVR